MKNNNIAAIKGLAMIGVVFQHLSNRRLGLETLAWIGGLQTAFCWCVFAFFATSGWLHALKEEGQKQPFGTFFILRVRRLLAPFVLLILVYAAMWQALQSFPAISLRGTIPQSYTGKVLASLWPSPNENAVAEQLYFLPMLFAICITAHLALRVGGAMGVACLGILCFIVSLFLFPNCRDTGFHPGVLAWGAFLYCGGFLLYPRPESAMIRGVLAGLLVLAMLVAGVAVFGKFAALALIIFAPYLRLSSIALLVAIGDASGTIYIYHTPFILQPLMIIAAKMHQPPAQFAASLAAGALAIAIGAFLYFRLRKTGLKRILM